MTVKTVVTLVTVVTVVIVVTVVKLVIVVTKTLFPKKIWLPKNFVYNYFFFTKTLFSLKDIVQKQLFSPRKCSLKQYFHQKMFNETFFLEKLVHKKKLKLNGTKLTKVKPNTKVKKTQKLKL